MMNACDRAEALVKAWEEGDAPSSADMVFLETHVTTCGPCGSRFGRLLPLMGRDSETARRKGPSKAALEIADGVMDAILGGEVAPPKPDLRMVSRGTPLRRRIPLIAAAAAAALALLWFVPTMTRSGDKVVVRFIVAEPTARSVSLVGDFTDWKASSNYLMHADASGRVWEIDVPLQRGKVYLYNFIVDGTKWTVDPAALEKVDDGFGGSSALLRL